MKPQHLTFPLNLQFYPHPGKGVRSQHLTLSTMFKKRLGPFIYFPTKALFPPAKNFLLHRWSRSGWISSSRDTFLTGIPFSVTNCTASRLNSHLKWRLFSPIGTSYPMIQIFRDVHQFRGRSSCNHYLQHWHKILPSYIVIFLPWHTTPVFAI